MIFLHWIKDRIFDLKTLTHGPCSAVKAPRYWFVSILLTISQTPSYASSEIGTLDTAHYIPPIYARSGLDTDKDVRDHFLQLSTLETNPFDVTITNASGSINETVTISKSSPQNVTLSAAPYGASDYGALNIVTDTGANTVNNEDGLVLTAPQRFYANIRHASDWQGGSLVAKGRSALGKRFRSGHVHTNTERTDAKAHFIAVMATQDDTNIDFADISPDFTFIGATPSTVVLDQYESFVVAVELDDGTNSAVVNDLNGTLITSDKPIAVNSGSFLAGHATPSDSGRDIGIDQIVPVDYLGTRFIPVLGEGGSNAANMEVPIVVADTDNTEIFINGNTTAETSIDAGEYYLISGTHYSNGSMFIRTSEPVYVYQSTSSNDSNGQAMNFVAAIFDNLEVQDLLVPSVEQLGSPTISIIAPSTATVTLDGTNLTDGLAVPGIAQFLLYIVNGETGDVEVSSTEPFSFTMTSSEGARGASAYYAGFPNSYAINDNATTQALSPVTIDVQANDVSGNNTFTVENTLVVEPSNGTAVVNANGSITYTPNAGFTSDTFRYRINNGLALTDEGEVTIQLDTDADGVADTSDLDSDNDGILNSVEDANSPPSNDTDGDGVEDKFDLDSDNDGIFDNVEAGHDQADTNNDGRIDDTVFFGDNGFADTLEDIAEAGNANYTLRNSDADDLEDYIDLDSDGDGLADNIEAQSTASYTAPDASYNANGVDTAYTNGLTPVNTLATTDADYLNTDADGQGNNDTTEAGLTLSGSVGNNGLDDAIEDADDYTDVNGTINDPATLPDEDSDNLPDFRDSSGLTPTAVQIDGANTDSIPENTTSGSAVGTFTSSDADSSDTFTYSLVTGAGDEDNDLFSISDNTLNLAFTPDFENPQDQGDTADDNTYSIRVQTTDSFGLSDEEVLIISITDVDDTPDPTTTDADNDGISDALEMGNDPNNPLDTDNDGTPDHLDTDADNDSVSDLLEGVTDTDGDGIENFRDTDSDGDGFGDALESGDFNNNGVADRLENDNGELETAVRGAGSADHLLLMLFLLLILAPKIRAHIRFPTSHMFSFFLLALCVATLTFSSPSFANSKECAQQFENFFKRCWYLGAGLGLSHVDPEGQVNGWSTDDDRSHGFGLHIGQHFSPHWYWELSYIDAGEAELNNVNPALNNQIPDAAIDYKIPSLMAGYYLWEKDHGWNLYAKAGLSFISTDATDARIGEEKQSTAQVAFGFGTQYRFENSAWFAQLQFDTFDRDARFLSLRISRYLGSSRKPQRVEPTPLPSPTPTPTPTPKPLILDVNKDGVVDEGDQCDKAAANDRDCAIVLDGVNFESNKAVLTPEASDILIDALTTLQLYPSIRIEVQAHTDSQGTEAYNQALSERRAKAVIDYFTERGIDLHRLEAKGYGESVPLESNATPEGRARNRRVELRVIE